MEVKLQCLNEVLRIRNLLKHALLSYEGMIIITHTELRIISVNLIIKQLNSVQTIKKE